MAAYELGMEIGEWDIWSMLRRMSIKDLAGWIAFRRLNPFGEYRADRRAAMVCAVLVDIHNSGSKSKPPPVGLNKFLINFQDEYNKNNPKTAGMTDNRPEAKQGLDSLEGSRNAIAMMKAYFGASGTKNLKDPRVKRVLIPKDTAEG